MAVGPCLSTWLHLVLVRLVRWIWFVSVIVACCCRSMFEHVATLGTGAFGEVDLVRKHDSCMLLKVNV